MTPPAAKADTSVCIPAAAARRIDADLRKLPPLLQENKHLRTATRALGGQVDSQRVALVRKDTALAATGRRVAIEHTLRINDSARATVAERRAKGRFWIILAETAAIILGGFLAVTH